MRENRGLTLYFFPFAGGLKKKKKTGRLPRLAPLQQRVRFLVALSRLRASVVKKKCGCYHILRSNQQPVKQQQRVRSRSTQRVDDTYHNKQKSALVYYYYSSHRSTTSTTHHTDIAKKLNKTYYTNSLKTTPRCSTAKASYQKPAMDSTHTYNKYMYRHRRALPPGAPETDNKPRISRLELFQVLVFHYAPHHRNLLFPRRRRGYSSRQLDRLQLAPLARRERPPRCVDGWGRARAKAMVGTQHAVGIFVVGNGEQRGGATASGRGGLGVEVEVVGVHVCVVHVSYVVAVCRGRRGVSRAVIVVLG